MRTCAIGLTVLLLALRAASAADMREISDDPDAFVGKGGSMYVVINTRLMSRETLTELADNDNSRTLFDGYVLNIADKGEHYGNHLGFRPGKRRLNVFTPKEVGRKWLDRKVSGQISVSWELKKVVQKRKSSKGDVVSEEVFYVMTIR